MPAPKTEAEISEKQTKADAQTATLVGELLVEAGRDLPMEGDDASLWVGAHVGLALDATDREYYLETLIAVAQEGAAVARSGDSEIEGASLPTRRSALSSPFSTVPPRS